MTPDEFANEMKAVLESKFYSDRESKHWQVHDLMSKALIALGYDDGIKLLNNTSIFVINTEQETHCEGRR